MKNVKALLLTSFLSLSGVLLATDCSSCSFCLQEACEVEAKTQLPKKIKTEVDGQEVEVTEDITIDIENK